MSKPTGYDTSNLSSLCIRRRAFQSWRRQVGIRIASLGPLLLSLPNCVSTIFRRIRLLLGSRANPAGFFFQGIRPLIGFAANGVRLVLGGVRTCFDRLVQTVSGTILGFPRPLRRPFLDRILARYDTCVGVGLLAGILAGAVTGPHERDQCQPDELEA
ncbi:hypothetical protein [Sphingomonas sp. ABOLG]|uniref:hypothetical protein n=1 Tax=Sphingomonas sp. ABOLG TaxID=1985880 RepID=UPI000F7E6F05|nr:hypothetical protein [Sphingomonas sp. ABOLG]